MMELTADADLSSVYMVIGVIVIAQFGTLVTVLVWVAKSVWWAAQQDLQLKNNTKDINQAFRKIRGQGGQDERDTKEGDHRTD